MEYDYKIYTTSTDLIGFLVNLCNVSANPNFIPFPVVNARTKRKA